MQIRICTCVGESRAGQVLLGVEKGWQGSKKLSQHHFAGLNVSSTEKPRLLRHSGRAIITATKAGAIQSLSEWNLKAFVARNGGMVQFNTIYLSWFAAACISRFETLQINAIR